MKSSTDIKKIAKETIAIELAAIAKIEGSINDDFVNAINLIISAKGR